MITQTKLTQVVTRQEKRVRYTPQYDEDDNIIGEIIEEYYVDVPILSQGETESNKPTLEERMSAIEDVLIELLEG